MALTETAVVTFALTGLEHTRGCGRLPGLADAEVVVEGVTFTAMGIRGAHDEGRPGRIGPLEIRADP